MTSILKALRKIEEEKRTDKHAAPDLMSDQGSAPAKSKPFKPLLAGVVLGALIVGLFFLWSSREVAPVLQAQSASKTEDFATVASQAQASASATQAQKATDSASTPDFYQKQALSGQSLKNLAESSKVSVATLPPEPVSVNENRKASTSVPVAMTLVKKVPLAENAETANNPLSLNLDSKTAVTVNALSKNPSGLPEGISLLVSEIYFQDDSDNSMAVVNDLPVMVGTHLDAAVVAEIRPDSVLFEIGDLTYVVKRSGP